MNELKNTNKIFLGAEDTKLDEDIIKRSLDNLFNGQQDTKTFNLSLINIKSSLSGRFLYSLLKYYPNL